MTQTMTSPTPTISPSLTTAGRLRSRRRARELALQILFQWDIHGSTDFWLEEFWAKQDFATETRDFAEQLVEGVTQHHVELDRLMNEYAINWRVERMPVVDRNILREALYELLWLPEVPAKVTVNETIELAKRFADDETRRFVNGILDRIFKQDARLDEKRVQKEHDEAKTTKYRSRKT